MRDITGERVTADPLDLPRRGQAWRSANGLLVIGVIGLGCAIGWAATRHVLLGPFVLTVLSIALWVRPVVAFGRGEGSNRLRLDSGGVSAVRRGEVLETTSWSHLTYVEFDSGTRLPSWSEFPPGILGFVRCHDDRPYDRWNPSDVGASVVLPVFGRRGLREIDDALRAACAEHGVEYRSHWSWAWRLRFFSRR